jgi:hypothetical protein
MFGDEPESDPYPGVAFEMEWNNKDPFFDRDHLNFQGLHREGALSVGVILTRGRAPAHHRTNDLPWGVVREVRTIHNSLVQGDTTSESRWRR